MKPSPPRPFDFWVGARVRRQFHGNYWLLRTVVGLTSDEVKTLYQIENDDMQENYGRQ